MIFLPKNNCMSMDNHGLSMDCSRPSVDACGRYTVAGSGAKGAGGDLTTATDDDNNNNNMARRTTTAINGK